MIPARVEKCMDSAQGCLRIQLKVAVIVHLGKTYQVSGVDSASPMGEGGGDDAYE